MEDISPGSEKTSIKSDGIDNTDVVSSRSGQGDGIKSDRDSSTGKTPSVSGLSNSKLFGNLMKVTRTRSKKKKQDFKVEHQTAPDNREGIFIKHPDCDKMPAKDYLLIARVVKRPVRPLTVAEANQRQRSI